MNINLGKLVTPFPNTVPSNCSVEPERGDDLKMEHQGLFVWQAILKPVPGNPHLLAFWPCNPLPFELV